MDTGASYLVLQKPLGPLTNETMEVQGATGQFKNYRWTTDQTVDVGQGTVSHSFIVIPECPFPLLGWDLLSKLKATISFSGENWGILQEP